MKIILCYLLLMASFISSEIWCVQTISARSIDVANFIKGFLPKNPVILEAGSYDGKDTKILARFWKHGRIHAFEPVPELYKLTKNHTNKLKNVKTYPVALSNQNGFATFFISEFANKPGMPSASSSLLAPEEHLEREKQVVFPKQITVKTVTIDSWAKTHNIRHIDLMWLDMQGHELDALKHATSILPQVRIIFTEVEFVKAYKNQPLYTDVKKSGSPFKGLKSLLLILMNRQL